MVDGFFTSLSSVGKFLAKIAEKSDSVYWLSSPDFQRIEYISPAYEKIWGRSRAQLLSHPNEWITFLHPDDVKNNYHPIESMKKRVEQYGNEARFEENYRIIRPNGNVRWIIDRGFPIVDSFGSCVGITGVATDVTAEKEIEENLRLAKSIAEEANKAKTSFLMNMSHDFRTPFSGILSLTSAIETAEKNPEKKKLLGYIAESARVLLNMHNEIFDFIQLEDNVSPVQEKKFDFLQLCHDVASLVRPSVMKKGLEFKFSIGDSTPRFLKGDSMRLSRILINLLTNAVKYTKEGSISYSVDLLLTNGRVAMIEFKVSDTGIGIPFEKRSVIFEKFTRLDPSYSSRQSGRGYGLYFVRRYLNDIGGEIGLNSKVGLGSIFTVVVPFGIPKDEQISVNK